MSVTSWDVCERCVDAEGRKARCLVAPGSFAAASTADRESVEAGARQERCFCRRRRRPISHDVRLERRRRTGRDASSVYTGMHTHARARSSRKGRAEYRLGARSRFRRAERRKLFSGSPSPRDQIAGAVEIESGEPNDAALGDTLREGAETSSLAYPYRRGNEDVPTVFPRFLSTSSAARSRGAVLYLSSKRCFFFRRR